jgi:aminoglycoside phosphotransferase (APT) family kinase protein
VRVQNVIFAENDRPAAALDWNMVSLAGAEADLAWFAPTDQVHTASKGLLRVEGFGTPAEVIALWEELVGRTARDMDWHVMFACYRAGAIMIRLATMLRQQSPLQPEAEYLLTNNSEIQWLASLLGTEPPVPATTPWVLLNR